MKNVKTLGTNLTVNMIHNNSLRFSQSKTINTDSNSLPNKTTRRMRHTVMVLLLCRLCSDVVKFCALEKIQEPMTTIRKNWHNNQFAR